MSTTYYRLAPPITSVRAETTPAHTHLTIWCNHANVGTLVLRNEEVTPFLLLLCERGQAATEVKDALSLNLGTVGQPGCLQLISEYGEVTTLDTLRGRHQ